VQRPPRKRPPWTRLSRLNDRSQIRSSAPTQFGWPFLISLLMRIPFLSTFELVEFRCPPFRTYALMLFHRCRTGPFCSCPLLQRTLFLVDLESLQVFPPSRPPLLFGSPLFFKMFFYRNGTGIEIENDPLPPSVTVSYFSVFTHSVFPMEGTTSLPSSGLFFFLSKHRSAFPPRLFRVDKVLPTLFGCVCPSFPCNIRASLTFFLRALLRPPP